jgi:hypothetical protein
VGIAGNGTNLLTERFLCMAGYGIESNEKIKCYTHMLIARNRDASGDEVKMIPNEAAPQTGTLPSLYPPCKIGVVPR